jgi:hypothetical protein
LNGEGNSGKTVVMMSVYEAFRARAIVTSGASVGFIWQDATGCRIILNEECEMVNTKKEKSTNRS